MVSALEGGYRIQGGIVSAFSRSVAAHVRALAEDHDQQWDPADAQVWLIVTSQSCVSKCAWIAMWCGRARAMQTKGFLHLLH